jgi:hypothetical protein
MTHKLKQEKLDGGASCCTVKLVTYEYRKTNVEKKRKFPQPLLFRRGHLAQKRLPNLARKGTKMTVYASARNGVMKTDATDDIVFRINEFDFGCLDKE